MSRAARILVVATVLTVYSAAVVHGYPWWVNDEVSGSWQPLGGVYAINDSLAWMVRANGGHVYKRDDSSLYSHDWTEGWLPGDYGYNDVFFTDVQHGWIVGQRCNGPDSLLGGGIVLRWNYVTEQWEDRTDYVQWPVNYSLPCCVSARIGKICRILLETSEGRAPSLLPLT